MLCIRIGIITLISGIIFGNNVINALADNQLTGEAINNANEYFVFLLSGFSLLPFIHILAGILSGEVLTKYIGIVLTIVNIGNIILAPIMIFLFNMGVKGAGLSTSIVIGLALLYYVVILLKGKSYVTIRWNVFNSSLILIKEILRIGAPTCLMIFSSNVAVILFNNLVGSISQTAMNS